MVPPFNRFDDDGGERVYSYGHQPTDGYQNSPWASITKEYPGSIPTDVSFPFGPPPWAQHTKHVTSVINLPEHGYPTSATSVIYSKPLKTSEAPAFATPSSYYWDDSKGSHKGLKIAAGIAVPMALLAIGALILFILLRRRKRNKQRQASAALENMKSQGRGQPIIAAHYLNNSNNPYPPPLPTSTSPQSPQHTTPQPAYTAPPSHPPPVILGPIPDSNGAYFTGIDTSDVVSITGHHHHTHRPTDRTGLGDPFADNNSMNDEPPPPYRPRSIAPLSRDSSLRGPPPPPFFAEHSRTNLLDRGGQGRSPFADPDDDAVSELSVGVADGMNGRSGRPGGLDDMSVVSDLEYQRDPVVNRPTV